MSERASGPKNQVWEADLAFGTEALVAVVPAVMDKAAELTDAQIREMAKRSNDEYWTDGETLWT